MSFEILFTMASHHHFHFPSLSKQAFQNEKSYRTNQIYCALCEILSRKFEICLKQIAQIRFTLHFLPIFTHIFDFFLFSIFDLLLLLLLLLFTFGFCASNGSNEFYRIYLRDSNEHASRRTDLMYVRCMHVRYLRRVPFDRDYEPIDYRYSRTSNG